MASSPITNNAAWLISPKASPFKVEPAPAWEPEADEILVRNRAVAINPVDGTMQALAWFPLTYPAILGHDVAGEVVAVGPNVSRFKAGDRVIGHCVGMSTKRNSDYAFQNLSIVRANMAAPLPDNIPYDQGAVIPLGCSTAAAGLFQDGFLELDLPTTPARTPSSGKTLLVWGASSSVGCNVVQLAVAAGYKVMATASPKNFGYLKQLGASEVFDRNSATIREELLAALKTKTLVGAFDCIGAEGWDICLDVVGRSQDVSKRSVVTVSGGHPQAPEGVTIKQMFSTTIKDNAVGKAIYEDFLPAALQVGAFVPAPEPLVVGQGLDSVQVAVDRYRKGGLSAQKLVVLL
ncbi:zinc-binding oxidoreductase CipB [Apodospora peruviana]|uniref:Zinc-binding oxidoreductase CipB n=1 Tax=Apodospora peruviana TaxID=516989 RepID=A0AAE0IRJ0_9PEZI|nr:zinc-binding oxidoreductase CipB [Apodospora peruviana]